MHRHDPPPRRPPHHGGTMDGLVDLRTNATPTRSHTPLTPVASPRQPELSPSAGTPAEVPPTHQAPQCNRPTHYKTMPNKVDVTVPSKTCQLCLYLVATKTRICTRQQRHHDRPDIRPHGSNYSTLARSRTHHSSNGRSTYTEGLLARLNRAIWNCSPKYSLSSHPSTIPDSTSPSIAACM